MQCIGTMPRFYTDAELLRYDSAGGPTRYTRPIPGR